MFEELYHKYLLHKNEENRKDRYDGNEGWYHASGAGSCSKKLYYESVEKLKIPPKTFEELDWKKRGYKRQAMLGVSIHENIQNALLYNNIYNNISNNKKEKKEILSQKKKKSDFSDLEFIVEGEITIPSLNIRGFYDVLLLDSSLPDFEEKPLVKLYDIKTMNTWNWGRIYPKGVRTPQAEKENYRLQLGTYGMAIKEEYGNLDYMGFIYYNITKDYS